ncbi:MAG: HD domain-containing protein [candidate division WOR-3 bacterium]|uniref:HD domain-containing protein n=1 Tax=candidate division WOR-3 bacterium TaxID=2052148 RepID=A0A7C1SWI2_UNCW3|nr:HD domain-containing protein [candidate division WOR-3 bacterium]
MRLSQVLSLNRIIKDPEVKALITQADLQLEVLGYTEHGTRHARLVAKNSRQILIQLGYDERVAELSAIAGYLHDIGNVVNREAHERTSAILARSILLRLGMNYDDVAKIMTAIGNHHEEGGNPVSEVASALILADKADVHRSRVRNPALVKFDIHDRVNYAVRSSTLSVDSVNRRIVFDLTIDVSIASVMEYFEIFLSRMLISRRAANFLNCRFEMIINNTRLV